MKEMIFQFLINLMTVDNIAKLFARMVCWLLEFARNKGDRAWDKAKAILLRLKVWIDLFLQVYYDDKLTKEEEKMIQEAIKNQTDLTKIQDILKKATEKVQSTIS